MSVNGYARTTTDTPVTVEFEQSTYTVAESDDSSTTDVTENEVEVKVTLSADPERTVTIPITTTPEGGATSSDYSGVPTSVTFDSGETEQTFTFTATADTVDDDREKVKLSFGALPAAVTAGATAESTVSITDDDDPQVTVSFGASTYTADEGGDGIAIVVKLSADPERTVSIPFTATHQGGAEAADYTFRDAGRINEGETEAEYRFAALQDTDEDHGESVLLGFGTLPPGVSLGSSNTTTTVTIIDDDPEVSITFGPLADLDYTIAEGEQVVVPVMLSAAPQRPLSIPITFSYMGGGTADDHMCTGATAVFTATQTTHNMTCTIVQDTIPDSGEIIQTNFGTLPPGVILGPGQDRTVQIVIVDDDPAVTVRFDEATYDVAEGDNVDVTVTLSADPQRLLTIPISAASAGSTTAADSDYDLLAAVRYVGGETSATFTFTTTENTTADHGKELDLSFGSDLPPGVTRASTNRTTTVTIIDDDPAVTVSIEQATYEVVEGGSLSVTFNLSEEPLRPVAIPVTITNLGGADSNDHNLNADYLLDIPAMHFSSSVTFRVSGDTLVERREGVKIAIGSDLPPGVTLGTVGEATVTFIDDDPAVTASFGAATYSVDEDDSVDVTVTLSADPQRSVTIPIAAPARAGAPRRTSVYPPA